METLKNLFGDGALTYDQFAEKLKDSKDVKLANLAEGQYVGKDKYSALEAERNALKTQLSEANTKLKGYDPEWEAKAEQARKDAEAQVGKVKFDYALDAALTAAKVRNPKAVRPFLDLNLMKLDGETISGLEEQLNRIRTSDGYLFAELPAERTGMRHTGTESTVSKREEANAALRSAFGKE